MKINLYFHAQSILKLQQQRTEKEEKEQQEEYAGKKCLRMVDRFVDNVPNSQLL